MTERLRNVPTVKIRTNHIIFDSIPNQGLTLLKQDTSGKNWGPKVSFQFELELFS